MDINAIRDAVVAKIEAAGLVVVVPTVEGYPEGFRSVRASEYDEGASVQVWLEGTWEGFNDGDVPDSVLLQAESALASMKDMANFRDGSLDTEWGFITVYFDK